MKRWVTCRRDLVNTAHHIEIFFWSPGVEKLAIHSKLVIARHHDMRIPTLDVGPCIIIFFSRKFIHFERISVYTYSVHWQWRPQMKRWVVLGWEPSVDIDSFQSACSSPWALPPPLIENNCRYNAPAAISFVLTQPENLVSSFFSSFFGIYQIEPI